MPSSSGFSVKSNGNVERVKQPVSSSATIEFNAEPFNGSLTLEYHIGNFQFGKGTPVRLYPNVNAKLAATKGTAELGETRIENVNEIVDFSGSTGSLKRPNGTNFIISPVLDISFDKQGNTVNPVVHYDSDNDQLVSDIPFYGAVSVSYDAAYKLIYYNPDLKYSLQNDGSYLLSEWGYGTLYAFYEGQSAKLEMKYEEDNPTQWMEFYRVVSDIVLDPDGSWEKPPNWDDNPKDGSFPVGDHDIDPDNSFTDERLHEIGDVSKIGQVASFWRRFYAPLLDPYKTAGTSFTPKYYLKWASLPSASEDPDGIWRAAFGKADKAAILASLQQIYTGIVVR